MVLILNTLLKNIFVEIVQDSLPNSLSVNLFLHPNTPNVPFVVNELTYIMIILIIPTLLVMIKLVTILLALLKILLLKRFLHILLIMLRLKDLEPSFILSLMLFISTLLIILLPELSLISLKTDITFPFLMFLFTNGLLNLLLSLSLSLILYFLILFIFLMNGM